MNQDKSSFIKSNSKLWILSIQKKELNITLFHNQITRIKQKKAYYIGHYDVKSHALQFQIFVKYFVNDFIGAIKTKPNKTIEIPY